jgi:hypothetical protein
MSNEKKDPKSTLADAIDATEWDFKPGKDRKILLEPVGTVFGEVPWEVEPQYLGPVPITEFDPEAEAEGESESETDPDDEDADTQPIAPLKK